MNWRNEKYRRLVAKQPCIRCWAYGSTQHAHANSPPFGKGGRIRAHDWAGFPLCINGCHERHDQYKDGLSKSERIDLEWDWIIQTLCRLYVREFFEPVIIAVGDHATCQTVAEAIVSKYTLKQLRAA